MPIDFTADLDYILRDASGAQEVNVVLGYDSTWGVVDLMDDLLHEEAEIRGTDRSVVVKTGALSELAIDASVMVDGVEYTVRDFARLEPDGALTRIWLAEA